MEWINSDWFSELSLDVKVSRLAAYEKINVELERKMTMTEHERIVMTAEVDQ